MSTLAQDSFTGSNGTALTAHTPDVDTVAGGWINFAGTWTIQGNRATEAATGDSASEQIVINSGQSDVYVAADVVVPNGSYACGLAMRASDANNLWFALIERDEADTGIPYIYIADRIAGMTTRRAQTNVNTGVSGTTVRFEVTLNGTGILFAISGGGSSGESISYSSSFNQTSAKHGLESFTQFSYAQASFDNFIVLSLSSGGVIPVIMNQYRRRNA